MCLQLSVVFNIWGGVHLVAAVCVTNGYRDDWPGSSIRSTQRRSRPPPRLPVTLRWPRQPLGPRRCWSDPRSCWPLRPRRRTVSDIGPFPWSQIFWKIISCRSKMFQNSIKLFGIFTIKCAVYYISLFFCLLNTFCCCIYISEMGGQNRYGSPTWTNHLKDCTKGGNQLSKINIMIYLLIINISNIIVCVFSSAFRTGRKKSLARIISFFLPKPPNFCENTW